MSAILRLNLNDMSLAQLRQAYNHLKLLPPNVSCNFKEFKTNVNSTILLQIVDIENITKSKINQASDILGEINPNNVSSDQLRNKNKQNNASKEKVVREIDSNGDFLSGIVTSNYYKLTLMDHKGNLMFAIEQEQLRFLSSTDGGALPITLGSKIIVNAGAKIILNVILLKNENASLAYGTVGNPVGVDAMVLKQLYENLDELKD